MSPALIETLLDAQRRAHRAGHGGKGAVYAEVCAQLGISRATLARHLQEITVKPERKRRSDAGQTSLSLADAQLLSAAMMEGYRANNKAIHSLKLALTRLRANRPGFAEWTDTSTGEIYPLSESACARALRMYGLHPSQLRVASAAQQQRSLHPNDVWQIDASISTLFYVPEAGVADMAPGVFYKNKPENFEKIKRQRLTRYVLTDHCSGSIFVHYVRGGESIANMAEAFLRAIQPRPNQQMHGVPFHLSMDPGSAGVGGAMKNLMRRLQVTPVVNEAGNPRAKGQVENAHNLVETDFESGFKFAHVPSIEWINEQAAGWMWYYNSARVHSRHGKTRYGKWLEITAEQLRLVDADLARKLLTHEPETPKVNQYLQVRFAGRVWDVSDVPGVLIGAKLDVTYNPFDATTAYVVQHDDEGHEQLLPIVEVAEGEHGYAAGAALIGREFKSKPDTLADTNRKLVERIATGAETDAQAEAARKAKAVPFGGQLDPYKHHDDVPAVTVLPRRGTQLDVQVSAAPTPEVLISAEEAMLRIARGIERFLVPQEHAFLSARLAGGVAEDQVDALIAQFKNPAAASAPERAVGGLRAV